MTATVGNLHQHLRDWGVSGTIQMPRYPVRQSTADRSIVKSLNVRTGNLSGQTDFESINVRRTNGHETGLHVPKSVVAITTRN